MNYVHIIGLCAPSQLIKNMHVEWKIVTGDETSSSVMAQRLREFGDFNGVGHFEAKFYVAVLHFAPLSME